MTKEELRALLKALGWRQADLVRRLSAVSAEPVSMSTVWRWLSGDTGIPAGVAAFVRLQVGIRRALESHAAALPADLVAELDRALNPLAEEAA